MEKATILIADDEPEVCSTLCGMTEKLGHKAISAGDGLEALERVRTGEVDLLLTDLSMPRMDGLELIRALKEFDPRIPVAVISGYGTAENVVEALNGGAFNFLSKPFGLEEVERVIRKGLLRRRLALSSGLIESLASHVTELTFPSDIELLPSVSVFILKECERRGVDNDKELNSIGLCLEEALLNAHEHGNRGDESKNIKVRLSVRQGRLSISVMDEGEGFPARATLEELARTPHKPPGRKGLFIIYFLMDRLRFNAKGNRLTMTKNLA